ncbi:hypothetical protein FQR65_LT20812 [Abscondita terminalis]|nr:hypothetical protein FQR65_LT20812 [Abscondita terminalis]
MPMASASEFIVEAVPIGIAMAGATARRGDEVDEALIVDLAGGHHLARPSRRSCRSRCAPPRRSRSASARPAAHRRDVDSAARHDLGRRGLVAAGRQHDAVERIAVEDPTSEENIAVAVERAPEFFDARSHRTSSGKALRDGPSRLPPPNGILPPARGASPPTMHKRFHVAGLARERDDRTRWQAVTCAWRSFDFGEPRRDPYPDPAPIYLLDRIYRRDTDPALPIREENASPFSAEETLALITPKTRLSSSTRPPTRPAASRQGRESDKTRRRPQASSRTSQLMSDRESYDPDGL